eukprot:1307455-Amphidinium_carterae.1
MQRLHSSIRSAAGPFVYRVRSAWFTTTGTHRLATPPSLGVGTGEGGVSFIRHHHLEDFFIDGEFKMVTRLRKGEGKGTTIGRREKTKDKRSLTATPRSCHELLSKVCHQYRQNSRRKCHGEEWRTQV